LSLTRLSLTLLCLALLSLTLLRLSLLALAGLLALTGLRLSAISASSLALLALALRELLHPITHAFQLRQRFLDVGLVARAFAGLALLLHSCLCLLQLIAQVVEPHGHRGFAHPGLHPLALTDPFRGFTHPQFEFILLGFGKRIAQFRRNRILRPRQTARGVAHLLFEPLQLIGHLFFFGGHPRGLLLRFSGLVAARE
jgi:hypothetical protein